MKVILYSTKCPKCIVLEKKLKQNNILYKEVNDIEIMKEKGYLSVPILEINGIPLGFKEAFRYIDSYQEDN